MSDVGRVIRLKGGFLLHSVVFSGYVSSSWVDEGDDLGVNLGVAIRAILLDVVCVCVCVCRWTW